MALSDQHPWLAKAAYAVAMAALLGGGSTVISNKMDNVRQDVKLEQLDELKETLEDFNTELNEANKHLAVLNDRMERQLNE